MVTTSKKWRDINYILFKTEQSETHFYTKTPEITPKVNLFLYTGSRERLNGNDSTRSASYDQSDGDDDRVVHDQKAKFEFNLDDDNEQVPLEADESSRAVKNPKVIVVQEASDDTTPEFHVSGQTHHDDDGQWNSVIASSNGFQKEDICENRTVEDENVPGNGNSDSHNEDDEDGVSEISSVENNVAESVHPEDRETPDCEKVPCVYFNSTETKEDDDIPAAHEDDNNFSNASSLRTDQNAQRADHCQNGTDNELRAETEQDTSNFENLDDERDLEYLDENKDDSLATNVAGPSGESAGALGGGDESNDCESTSDDDGVTRNGTGAGDGYNDTGDIYVDSFGTVGAGDGGEVDVDCNGDGDGSVDVGGSGDGGDADLNVNVAIGGENADGIGDGGDGGDDEDDGAGNVVVVAAPAAAAADVDDDDDDDADDDDYVTSNNNGVSTNYSIDNFGDGVGGRSNDGSGNAKVAIGDGFETEGGSVRENGGIPVLDDAETRIGGGDDDGSGLYIVADSDVASSDVSGYFPGKGDGDDDGASGGYHPPKTLQRYAEKDDSVLAEGKEHLQKG